MQNIVFICLVIVTIATTITASSDDRHAQTAPYNHPFYVLAHYFQTHGNSTDAQKFFSLAQDMYIRIGNFDAAQQLINEITETDKQLASLMPEWQNYLNVSIMESRYNDFNNATMCLNQKLTPNARMVAKELQQIVPLFKWPQPTILNSVMKFKISALESFFMNTIARAKNSDTHDTIENALVDANTIIFIIDKFILLAEPHPQITQLAKEKNDVFKITYDIAAQELKKRL